MGSNRAFISARAEALDFSDKVGKTEVVIQKSTDKMSAPGYHCEVCQCVLKDSAAYLAHVNGKKHQRNLGFSMRTERSNVNQVKDRLAALKKKREDMAAAPKTTAARVEGYEKRMRDKEEEEERAKAEKKESAKRRRMENKAKQQLSCADDEEGDPQAAEMAAMMGFGGFGSSKK